MAIGGQKSWWTLALFLSSVILASYFSTHFFKNSMHDQAMAIKVHGTPFSTATTRVLAAAYEKDLKVELVPVDTASGAYKKQSHLSLNPFGQIPAVEDGDVKLFESRAITKYIASTYESKGTQLLVTNKKHKPIWAVWLEVEAHQFDPVASKLVWEQHYKKIFKQEIDANVVEENEAKLAKVLDVYEAHLSKSKYLAGDSFTLADLHHLPTLQWLLGTPTMKLFEERPHVHAWCKDILARPSWAKILAFQKL